METRGEEHGLVEGLVMPSEVTQVVAGPWRNGASLLTQLQDGFSPGLFRHTQRCAGLTPKDSTQYFLGETQE